MTVISTIRDCLPEDRAAISRVQDAIQKWGKLIVVYRPEDADMVIASNRDRPKIFCGV